jgi:carbonic anhydrase
MKTTLGKAALLALSMMPVTVFASHWSYEGEGSPEHWGRSMRSTKPVKMV